MSADVNAINDIVLRQARRFFEHLYESGRGQPHSKTLTRVPLRHSSRSVLECACPLAPFKIASTWMVAFLILVVTFAAFTSRADNFASDFDTANKLYEEGHFADAATAYERLLGTGKVSESLYFNRGNALFKAGQLGRAIASYRQAQLLSPRDSALRANLQFARSRARGGSLYRGDRWRALLNSLSLNEWTLLAMLALWILFALLAWLQWKPELKEQLRNPLIFSTIAVALFGTALGIVINQDYFTTSAIVVAGEAEVRNGPLDEAPAIFKVRDGAELEVTDEKDNWLQVLDSAQRVGWLRSDQAILFEPAAARKSRALNMLEKSTK